MRVLLVNTYYYPEMIGGAEHCVKKLAEQLCAFGVECAVLCSGAQDEDAVIEGVPVFRRKLKKRDRVKDLGGASKPVRLLHELQNLYCPQNAQVIDPVLKAFNPDVIHTNGLYDISPVVWRCAKKRGIPVVHTLHDYSMLCPRVQLMHKGQTKRCEDPYIWCRAYRAVNQACSRHVDVVTAPSRNTLTVVRDHGQFKKAWAEVVVNATEIDSKTPERLERRFSREADCFTVVYLGELTEKKGLKWLIEEFSSLEDSGLRLAIAGRGPMEDDVRRAADQDKRIRYMGYLNEAQVGQLLDESDVLACPSLWEEPFGRIVIDAYKHVMPVIASDLGAFTETVIDGETGAIVPHTDRSALGRAIMMYRSDREAWIRCCKNAAVELRKYSMDAHVRAFIRLYQRAMGKAGAR